MIIFSCEKENNLASGDIVEELNKEIEFVEGILSFNSKNLLQKTVKSLKNKDNTTKNEKLKGFYDNR